jgi:hypothetical protein
MVVHSFELLFYVHIYYVFCIEGDFNEINDYEYCWSYLFC